MLVSVALVAAGLQVFVVTPSASALPTTTVFYEPLHNNLLSTGGSLMQPVATGNTNNACLTASGNTTVVPKSCTSGNDANGSGVLRLTTSGGGLQGSAFTTATVPMTKLVDVTFNLYDSGSGAAGDGGTAFVIAASNPTSPGPPATMGYISGTLGYTGTSSVSGLVNGYLGIGFDAYGNYSNSANQGSGCGTNPPYISSSGTVPGQVVVRGPGTGTVGYCAINSTASTTSSAALALRGATRAAAKIPVEVVINPGNTSLTTTSGLAVAALSYLVAFTPVGGSQRTLTGLLPSASGILPASYLSANGIPQQITFGWTGTNGGNTDVREVDTAQAETYPVNVPVLGVTQTAYYDNSGVLQGEPVSYVVVPSVSSGVTESATVTLTKTMPSNVTPVGGSGTGWTCTVSGQAVTCTNPNGPFTAGTSLAAVTILGIAQVAVTAATITGSSTAVVSSSDGASATTPTSTTGPTSALPTVAISPATGPALGGNTVAVTGTNLSAATAIVPVTSTDFQNSIRTTLFPCQGTATSGCFIINSATSITIPSMPSHAAGTVPVLVVALGIAASPGPNYAYTSPNPPTAPASVTATAGIQNAAVSWTAPANTNGSPVTSYTVTPYKAGVAQTAIVTGTTALSTTVSGLTAGVSYTFAVAATNTCTGTNTACGTGAATTSNAVVPNAVPAAPTSVAATAGTGQATVTWTAPAANGGTAITSYVITPFIGATAQTTQIAAAGVTSKIVTGLTAGSAYTFTIVALNTAGTGASSAATNAVTINAGPVVGATAPAAGEVAVPYTTTFTATGGTTPYTWSLASGTFPAGLSLAAGTGVMSGTPTAAGSFTFTVQVVDSGGGTASRAVTLVIAAAPVVAFAPAAGEITIAYSQQATTTGGTAPYGAWSLTAGSLPAGVTLNTSTGVISGTPTASGTFPVTLSITDAFGQTANRTASVVIAAAPTLTSTPPAGQVGFGGYAFSFVATGGTSPFTYSLTAGTLPPGMAFASTGVLSGGPSKAGTYPFTIKVVDNFGLSALDNTTMTIAPAAVSVVKSANVTSSAPGAVVTFTITANNSSSTTSYLNTQITDPLSDVLDDAVYNNNASASSGTVTYANSNLVWNIPMTAGSTFTMTYSVTVSNPDVGNKLLTGIVSTSFVATNCNPGDPDSRCSAPVPIAVLSLVQTASVATTTPGSVVTYTVVVTNTGQTAYAAQSATFTESLAGVLDDATYNTATASVGTVSYSSPTISWTGNLAVGASATITYSVTVASPDTGDKSLTGTIVSTAAGSTCPSGAPTAGCIATVAVLVPALVITNAIATPTPQLLGHWTFDEGTGTTAADSAGSHPATLSGGAGWAPGVQGPYALARDGTLGAADAGAAVLDTTKSFSVSALVKLNNLNGYQTVISQDGVSGSGFYLELRADTGRFAMVRIGADANNAATYSAGALAAPLVGQWYRLVGVYDAASSTMSLYVDGVLQSTAAVPLVWAATGDLVIGRGKYNGVLNDYVNGSIDDVQVYSGVLTGASPAAATPGAVLPLTTTISNSGQTAYTATSVTLALPAAADDAVYNNDAAASSGSLVYNSTANTLVWTGTLAVGAVVRITATMTVRNPDPGDKTVTTVASSAAAGSSCPVGSSNSTCTAIVQVLIPALTITKAANVSSTTPGSVVQYTVTVTNSGQTNYTGATFADGLTGILDDAAYTSASATSGTVSFSSPTLTWTGDLLIGATATITYSVTVNNPDSGNKSLAATITSTTAGSNCVSGSTDTRCTSTVPVLIPGLTLSLVVDSATTTPGSVVRYTMSASNTGQTTYTNVPITVNFTGAYDDATYNNDGSTSTGSLVVNTDGTGVWVLTLAPGASATGSTSFTVNTPDGGDKSMPTVISSDAPGSTCPTGSANTVCKTATTVLIPGLTIVKTANLATVVTGGTVVYTIVVTNTGQSAYAAANFTDSLSTVLTDATYAGGLTATSGTASYAAPVVSWSGALAVGASATISYSITILDPDPGDKRITNAAVSTSAGSNCPAGATDTRCFATVNIVVPGLTIVKTANTSTTVPGAVIGYTITVTNSGQTAYTGAAFTDSLTGVLDDATYNTNVAASSGTASYAGSTINWTGDLAIGAVATITYSVTVHTADGGNNLITDTAVSSTRANNCASGSVDARCTVTVPVARLIILAVAAEPTTTPGSVVHLTTTITNTGQVPYTGISINSTGADLSDDVILNGDQTSSSGTQTISATSSTWTGNVPVGGVVTLTLSVTVLNPDPGNKIITSTWTSTAPGNNCAAGSGDSRCTILSRVLIPGLAISTTANAASVAPAGVIVYTVTLFNSGQTAYTAATVADSLTGVLDDATYNSDVSASAGAVSFASPTLTWTGNLAVGATVTITFSATARSPDPGDKAMSNVVSSAAVGNSCPAASGNAACIATVQVLTPALTIVKSANVTAATLGSTVNFTTVVTNTGQTPYTGATYNEDLTDVVDDAAANTLAVATSGAITIVGQSVVWTGNLAVGASATITYPVIIRNPDTGNGSLSGKITSTTAGSNCAAGSTDIRCNAIVSVINSVSLTVAKTANVATTVAGAVVTYTDTAVNASTSAIAANFTDPLSGILDDAAYNNNATVVGGGAVAYTAPNLSWSGTVPAGGTVTVTYTVTVNATITGDEILTGRISSTLPAASNNCLAASVDTRCASAVPIAALVIRSLNSGTTTPGSTVVTTATYANTGQVPYVGISISSDGADLLDDVTAVGDQHATSGSLSISPTALVWTGDIPIGATVTVTSSVTVNNPDTGNKLLKSTSTSTAPGNNCQSGSTDPRCVLSIAVLIPGLTFTSTASVPTIAPGGTVTFTIAVKNTGQTPYTGAAFTDPLTGILDDATYDNDATATTGTVSYSAPTLSWTGNLAVGATATITFTATAQNPDPGDKGMSHTVSSSTVGSNCLPASGAAGCSATVIVLTPGLTIVKTANPASATLGSTVTYTVVVSNTGQTSYPAATFTDNLTGLLDDATYNSGAATATTGTLGFSSPTLTWTGALAPGAAATITYTVSVNNPDTGDRSMADTVISTSTGNNCPAVSTDPRCGSLVAITNQPTLRFTKTSDVATSVAGGIVHYTVVVLNSSSGAVAANFTDPLAGILDDATYNTDAVASSGALAFASPNLTWSGTIPAGVSVTVTYSVTVQAAITGDQILSGTLSSTSLPGSNNCAAGSVDPRCTSTVPIARLDLVQTATETSATPGSLVHITAVYTNTGKVAYSGITVNSPRADTSDDTIPTGDQVATSGTLVRTPTNLTWTGDIPVGGSVTVTRTLTVQNPDPGNQRITATLNSTAIGNNCPAGTVDPRCTFLISVVTPGLTLTTTAGTAATMPGSTVGYTVTVTNTGQTAYTGASFTDSLSGLLNDANYNTNAAATLGTVSYTSPTITWTGDLAIGATATITFSMTVNNPDTGDKTMVSTVTSNTVGSTCPPASSNTACHTTVLVLTPALTIVKTASLPTVTLGSTVTYTIVVTNSGQTAYSAANFSDSLAGVLDDATYNTDAAATIGTTGYSGGVLTWTGALAVGASATVTYTVTVANPDSGDKSMSNTVTSTSSGSDCASGSTDTRCTAVVAVVNAVTLTFVNTADVLSTVAGAVVHYTVTVTNSSASAIVGANFTDPLSGITDDAVYNANAAATSGTLSYTSPNLTWTGDVPAGGTVTVTYSVTVNTAVTGDQILTGTVTSTSSPASDNCISGHTGPRCTSAVPIAALLIQQSYTEATTTPGSVVHLSATFTNTGQFPYVGISVSSPSADTVDDAIPSGDQTATSGNLVLTAAGIIWTGNIPVGGVVTVVGTLTVENPDPGNKILTGTLVSAAPGNNCPSGGTDPRCTATSTVLLPGLTITKSASTATTTPGSSVGYTILIQNTGQTAYPGATVTDSLSGVLDDATYNGDSASTSGTLTYNSPTLTWTGALAVGATVTITYSFTVYNPDPGDKSLVDSAVSNDVGSTCPTAAGAAACRSSVDVLTPGLTIVKTANVSTATLGSIVRFTVVVTNSGQTPYSGATYTDNLAGVLDDATYNVDATATTGSINIDPPSVVWTGDLAVGASATITYTDTIYNPDTGDRLLTGTIVSATTGSNCATGSIDPRCSAVVPVTNSVSLILTKTADVTTTVAGGVVAYTVTVGNASTAPIAANFTDPLAGIIDDATFNGNATASSGTVTYTNPNLAWSGTIAAGATVTVTYSVTVHTTITGDELLTGTLTSTTAPGSNDCAAGSLDSRCANSVPVAALVIVQTFSTPTTTPGSVIQVGSTFTNTGQMPYVGITIAAAPGFDDLGDDAVPTGSASASSGVLTFGSTGLTWTGDIPVGGTVTIGSAVTVNNPDTGNRVMRTTLVSAAAGNNCLSGSTDTRCTAIATVLLPGLTLVNSADTSTVVTGGIVHFTISVTNSGQTAYSGASFTDALAGLLDDATYNNDAAATSGTSSFASGTLSWTGDLAVGATAVVTFSATARNPDPGDKAMSQTVVSATAGSSCLPASASAACSSTVVVLSPALTIVKTANVAAATLGSTVTYTVVVSNTGQTPYSSATFSDSLAGVLDDATYNAGATTASIGTVGYNAGVLSWSGTLNPGDVATVSYTVTVASPSSGDLTMSNTVVSTTTGNNCAAGSLDARCTAIVAITNSVSVAFTQTADVASSVAGGVVNYTVSVVNASTSPVGSNFTDSLTGVLDDATYSGGAVATAGTVTYSAPNLSWSGTVAALSTVTVTYAVTVNAVGTGDENLTDTLTSTVPTTSNNCLPGSTDSRCTTAVPIARLTLAYSSSIPTTITPGGTIHYVSTYTNTGKVPYFGISVVTLAADAADDELPGTQTVTSGTLTLTATGVTWNGDIPVGGTVTLDSLNPVKNPDTGDKFIQTTIVSTAVGNSCFSGSTDPQCVNTINVLVPGLTMVQTANVGTVNPGGVVQYTVLVTNSGQTPYSGAVLTDSLVGVLDDAGYNNDATATTGTVTYSAPTLTWTGDLAVGASTTITYTVTASKPDPGDKVMANTVASSEVGSSCLPDSGGAGCSTTVAVLTPGLTLLSSASVSSSVPGAVVTYTVTATNTGQMAYTRASFSDPLAGILDDATYNDDASAGGTGTLTYTGGVLGWSGPLALAASVTVTFSVTVANPDAGDHRLGQTLTSTNQGSDCLAGGTDPRCSTSVPVGILQLVSTSDVATTKPTGVVHYTNTFTNTGQVPYVGVTVLFNILGATDDATYNGDGTATAGTVTIVAGVATLSWTGDLPVGATVVFTASVTVKNPDPGNKLLNTAMTTTAAGSNCPVGGVDPACSTLATVQSPGLTISKTADVTTTTPGSTVTYTLTIANTGQTAYTAATVTDSLDSVLTDATYSGGASATRGAISYTAPVLTWTGDLAVGASAVVTYAVVIDNPDLGDKTMVDTAVSNELGSNCPTGGTAPACTTLVTVLVPALAISMTSDSTTTTPGSIVGYTLTIANIGQTPYNGATVTAALAGLLDDAGAPSGTTASIGTATFTTPNLTWTGNLAVGATAVVTYNITVANPDVGDQLLTTSVASAEAGGTCTAGAPCVNTVTVLTPGLAVSTTANVATATPGDQVIYTVTIANTGQTAYVGTTVTADLTDVVDDATFDGAITASLGVAGYTAPTLTWTGSLPVGTTAVITYSVTVRSPDPGNKVMPETVVADAAGSTCATGSSNPACTTSVAVLVPALTIVESADQTSVIPGSVVNYTILITNTGQTPYTGATISDVLTGVLDDATVTSGPTASAGTASYTAPSLTWTGNLIVGASASITYSVTVRNPDPGDKQISQTVTSSTPGSSCPTGGTLAACTTSVQVVVPKLTVTQTTDTATVVAGSAVHYTVTVVNSGQTDFASAALNDPLAGVLDDAVYSGDAAASSGTVSYAGNSLSWSGPLAIGVTATITFSVTTTFPDTGDHVLSNTTFSPTVGSNCIAGTAARCNTAVVVLVPALTISQTASTSQVVAGGVISYTIVAVNTGQADYPAATITDSLAGVLANSVYNADATATMGAVSYVGSTLSWTGVLPVGGTVTIVYSVTTNQAASSDATLVNAVVSPSVGSTCTSPSAVVAPCAATTTVAARSIGISDLSSGFTLNGLPDATVTADGAVTMTVTTNSPAGYTVTVQASSDVLTSSSSGNTVTIPLDLLLVRENDTDPWVPVTSIIPTLIHRQNTASAPGGDAVSSDFQMMIPFVPNDTYTTTLDYIASAQ